MGALRRFFLGAEAKPVAACAEAENVTRLCASDKAQDRVEGAMLAKHVRTLETLSNDPSPDVRQAVAERGYAHMKLAVDDCPSVAYTVVRVTQCKDVLRAACRNNAPSIRIAAMSRLGADAPRRMVRDRDEWVRAAYAAVTPHVRVLQGLMKDSDPAVRAAVAKRGYGLSVLCEDKNAAVREAAALTGDHSVCAKLKDDPVDSVRIAVAEAGRWHSQLSHDPSKTVRDAVKSKEERGSTTPVKGCQFDSAPFRAIRSN